MELKDFVKELRRKPVPTSIVSDGKIVDGATNAEWTAEQITAEAFNQEILAVDTYTWEKALEEIKAILSFLL